MEQYPTRNGIAVAPTEIWLPESHKRGKNNHHAHFTGTKYARTAATLALRDLNRHQHVLPLDVHKWLHDNYEPPEIASEQQAAHEIIEAYDMGEQFKIYDRYAKRYGYHEIPKDIVDGLVATHSIKRIFDMAAD